MDKLEQQLKAMPKPQPDAALYGTLMAQFENRHKASNPLAWLWPFGPVWQPAFGLAAVAVMGLALAPQPSIDTQAQWASLDFDTLVLGESYETEVTP